MSTDVELGEAKHCPEEDSAVLKQDQQGSSNDSLQSRSDLDGSKEVSQEVDLDDGQQIQSKTGACPHKCTQVLRVVLKKRDFDQFKLWREQIGAHTKAYPGVLGLTRFQLHGDMDTLQDKDDLTFIVIITFATYADLMKFSQDEKRCVLCSVCLIQIYTLPKSQNRTDVRGQRIPLELSRI